MPRDRLWRIGIIGYFLVCLAICFILLSYVLGCAYQLSDINTGVSAGRTFEDGRVFDTGKTAWGVTVSGHWSRRDK